MDSSQIIRLNHAIAFYDLGVYNGRWAVTMSLFFGWMSIRNVPYPLLLNFPYVPHYVRTKTFLELKISRNACHIQM